MISVVDRVKNIVGKGENAGYQHFLPFPQCFQKAFFFKNNSNDFPLHLYKWKLSLLCFGPLNLHKIFMQMSKVWVEGKSLFYPDHFW